MKCRICGGLMERRITDLPFKVVDCRFDILEPYPYSSAASVVGVEQATMMRVDQLLSADEHITSG